MILFLTIVTDSWQNNVYIYRITVDLTVSWTEDLNINEIVTLIIRLSLK